MDNLQLNGNPIIQKICNCRPHHCLCLRDELHHGPFSTLPARQKVLVGRLTSNQRAYFWTKFFKAQGTYITQNNTTWHPQCWYVANPGIYFAHIGICSTAHEGDDHTLYGGPTWINITITGPCHHVEQTNPAETCYTQTLSLCWRFYISDDVCIMWISTSWGRVLRSPGKWLKISKHSPWFGYPNWVGNG